MGRRRPLRFPWRTRLRLCARYSWRFLRTGDEDYLSAAEIALRGSPVAMFGWTAMRATTQVHVGLAGIAAGVIAAMPTIQRFYDAVMETQRVEMMRQVDEALRS